MKLVLVAINARFSHSNLALLYLQQVAQAFPDEIVIKSFTINTPEETIIQELIGEKADAYGFSVYIWNAQLLDRILPRVKQVCPKACLFLGGPEVSYTSDTWIDKHPEIDYIICGPGEAGFQHLLETGFSHNEKTLRIPNHPFSKIPFAYKNIDFSIFKNRFIYYESTRGCPFRCTFCLSSLHEEKMQFRKLSTVLRELSLLQDEHPPLIKFVDRTFNSHRAHYQPIWQFLINESSNNATRFHFEIDPALLDKSDFSILEQCPPDLFQFEIGIQSINPESLKAVKRNISWHKTRPNIERLIGLKNIHIHADLLVGLPHDSSTHITHAINEVYSLGIDHLQLGFLKILPGTKISSQTGTYSIRFQENPPYEIIQNRWLAKDEIAEFKQIARSIEVLHNPQNLRTTLKELVGQFESAFAFFQAFSRFIATKYISNKLKHQEEKVEALILFIEDSIPGKKQFLIDCLRWDWCCTAKDHRYPKILTSKQTMDARKKGIHYCEEQQKNKTPENNFNSITKSDLKRSIFFKPETNEFRQKYCKNKTTFIFFPDKTRKILF